MRFDRGPNEGPQGTQGAGANNIMAAAIGFQPGSHIVFWRRKTSEK